MDRKQELEEVIRKAKKLMAFNLDNATEAEVENATAILGKMLEKYQLSMADLESGDVGEGVEELELDSKCMTGQSWMGALVGTLAVGFGCKAVQTRKRRNGSGPYGVVYVIVGHKSDTVMVEYLFGTLQRTLRAMGRADGAKRGYAGGALRGYVNSYVIGATRAIHRRLKAEREHAGSDSKALVVVKDGAVEKYMRTRFGGTLRNGGKLNCSNRAGLADGYEAGKRVSLARGVGHSATAPKTLTHSK